jgi:hypothetical protein
MDTKLGYFLLGTIGSSSPIKLLDKPLLKRINALVCPNYLLKEMLSDMNCLDDWTYQTEPIKAMLEVYTKSDLPRSCVERLNAYQSGFHKDYLKRKISVFHCYECDRHWFADTFPPPNKSCPCGERNRVLIRRMYMSSIPPWVDVDTYYYYPTGLRRHVDFPVNI